MSIAELGISQENFAAAMPDLVRGAFEDMAVRTNPAVPLFEDLKDLFINAYAPRQRP
jgi:alcohol dehydrogenase class IV